MATRNPQDVRGHPEAELEADHGALSILETLGPKLLALLAGDRDATLNRDASARSSSEIGATFSQAGREAIFPVQGALFASLPVDGR